MNYSQFISEMTKLEAGKSQVKVGDMREVFKRAKKLIQENSEALEFLIRYLKLNVGVKDGKEKSN